MSGSMGKIVFLNVAGDRHDVVSSLVQLSIPFRRLHTFAAGAVYDAGFDGSGASRTVEFVFLLFLCN